MNKYYKSFHFLFVCHSYIKKDDTVIFTSNETDIIKVITVLSTPLLPVPLIPFHLS